MDIMENFINLLCNECFEAYKASFINYIRGSFPLCVDDIMDIYIDVWADVMSNVRRGKTERVNNWKSYIFRLGWKRAYKLVKRRVEMSRIDDTENPAMDYEATCLRIVEDDQRHIIHLKRIERIMEALAGMPDKHREILDLYYIKGMSTEEIAGKMGYSGQRTVITMKRRSVDLLKKTIGAVA